jgi:hypothetical protein
MLDASIASGRVPNASSITMDRRPRWPEAGSAHSVSYFSRETPAERAMRCWSPTRSAAWASVRQAMAENAGYDAGGGSRNA